MATSTKARTKSQDDKSSAARSAESAEEHDNEFDAVEADGDHDDQLTGEFGGDIDDQDDDDDELDAEFDGADVDDDEDDDSDADNKNSSQDIEEDETEQDLAAMLKTRMGASDDDEDDEDDEEDEVPAITKKRSAVPTRQTLIEDNDDLTVQPRQATETVCDACFLIVNKAAARAVSCPHCGADRTPFAAV